ncbi:unnamed protein product, partial [Didymodactylos carnosus]
MFPETCKTLLQTIKDCKSKNQSPPSKQPLRLRKVIITALAIRKFQKFESDKFKQSIECVFDKTVAINELKRFHTQDKSFYLKEPKKFAYYIRKFTLTFDELKSVHTDLLSQLNQHLQGLDGNVDERVQYWEDPDDNVEEQVQDSKYSDDNVDEQVQRSEDSDSNVDEHVQYWEKSDGNIDEQVQRSEDSDGNVDEHVQYWEDPDDNVDEEVQGWKYSDGNADEQVQRSEDSDGKVDEQAQYFLCLSLKYLTRNSKTLANEIQYADIINLMKRCKNEFVRTELVYTLAYMTEKSTLNNELINELNNLVLNRFDINEDAKGLLLIRLENSKSIPINDQLKTEHRFKSTGQSNGNNKMNKLIVTKTIQTVKSNYNNKDSEETKMIFLNLSDALKNRNRKLNMNTKLEEIDTVNDTTGDNRSMWRSTWAECINLYSLVVIQGQALKSDDKDNYLPKRLFGWHAVFDTNMSPKEVFTIAKRKKIYSFLINRMIVATLLRTSKKQQLNNDAIDKLMRCVTEFDNFVSILLNSKDDMVDLFVDGIYAEYNALNELKEPDIVVTFVKTIINKTIEVVIHKGWLWNSTEVKQKTFNKNELTEIIKTEINRIRLDSLNAIYNCSIRNKQVLTKERIKKIQKCLTNYQDDNVQFTKLIFQLMNIANSTNEIDYKTTFETYVNLLIRGISENSEVIINFMNNQAKDMRRSAELFTNDVLEKLINLLNNYVYDNKIKEDIMEIINNYLEHETNKALKDKHLESLIEYVMESSDSTATLINSVLTSILIIAEKGSSLSMKMMKKLINNMECFDESCSNYILLILSRVIQGRNYIEDEQDLEKISLKLESDNVVILNEDSKINF